MSVRLSRRGLERSFDAAEIEGCGSGSDGERRGFFFGKFSFTRGEERDGGRRRRRRGGGLGGEERAAWRLVKEEEGRRARRGRGSGRARAWLWLWRSRLRVRTVEDNGEWRHCLRRTGGVRLHLRRGRIIQRETTCDNAWRAEAAEPGS